MKGSSYMSYVKVISVGGLRFAAALTVSACAMAFGVGARPAMAQDAPAADAKPAAAPAKSGPNWVKICEKVPFPDPAAKDPKTAKPIEKQVCATQHESFDKESGSLLVSVAVRQIEGSDKQSLLVGTPLGVVLPAGLALQFDDEKEEAKFVKLRYDFCLPTGCNSESELTPEILERMNKAKVMRVLAATLQGTTVPFKMGMEDFATAMAGNPVDTAKYLNARKNLVLSLREKMIAKQKATQAAAAEAIKGIQEDAAAAGGAAPAEPPKQ
jgi:invasion protein IalB